MLIAEFFIVETTDEDRALISLSSAIYQLVSQYIDQDVDYTDEDEELLTLGKLKDLFDSPLTILDNITLELQGGDSFINRIKNLISPEASKHLTFGMWDPNTKTIILNLDHLDDAIIKTTITHELRHALDDYKSDLKTSTSKRYSTPRNKKFRVAKDKNDLNPYHAQPAEINARFLEAMHVLINRMVPKRYAQLPEDKIKHQLIRDLYALFDKYSISKLFVDWEDSADYKRLKSRAMRILAKEIMHYENQKTSKIATGSW